MFNGKFGGGVKISIHAPREGSDGVDLFCLFRCGCISIHAPREGSDLRRQTMGNDYYHFYPRSPRGERPTTQSSSALKRWHFYPRSPRGERQAGTTSKSSTAGFLSTLPARGATYRS